MIKIRLMGRLEEVEEAIKLLDVVFRVRFVSPQYPTRDGLSVRVYVETE